MPCISIRELYTLYYDTDFTQKESAWNYIDETIKYRKNNPGYESDRIYQNIERHAIDKLLSLDFVTWKTSRRNMKMMEDMGFFKH